MASGINKLDVALFSISSNIQTRSRYFCWYAPQKMDITLNVHSSTLYSIELGIVPGSFLLETIAQWSLFLYCKDYAEQVHQNSGASWEPQARQFYNNSLIKNEYVVLVSVSACTYWSVYVYLFQWVRVLKFVST